MSKIIIPSDDDVHMADDDGLTLCGYHRYARMNVLRRYLDYVDVRIAVKMTDNVYRVTCRACLDWLKVRLFHESRSNPDVEA